MTMAPTRAGRGISSARRASMWEVNNRWLYGFPTCMDGIPEQQRVCALFLISFWALLEGDHACAGATTLSYPTETALDVVVGHHKCITQAFTLKRMHQGKGLRNGKF